MKNDEMMLGTMAQIGAMRKLVLSALALRLVEENEPLRALDMLGGIVTNTPTPPADTGGTLNPAMSDLLSALTDEHVGSMIDDLRQHLTIAA